MQKAKVVVWGVGGMGSEAVRTMLDKEWTEVVGAIDTDREKVGKDLGEVVGAGRKLGIVVSDDPDDVFSKTKADMVLHLTIGYPEELEAQVMRCIQTRSNVISSGATTLAYPWVHWPELGRRFDEAAKENGVTVLCAGTIPGMLELFPIMCSGAFSDVRKIYFKLTSDLEGNSDVYLKRHGVGLTPDEYQKGLADGSVGWLVLEERIDMITDALGWKLDEIRRKVEPIICKKKKKIRPGIELEPGEVCGSHYLLTGMKDGEAVVNLDFALFMRPEEERIEPVDSCSIEGEPAGVINVAVEGGLNTDWAYIPAVNRIRQVMEARPGLIYVKDLPLDPCLR